MTEYGGVDNKKNRNTEQAESNYTHSHHRATGKCDRECFLQAGTGAVGRAVICRSCNPHAEETGKCGKNRPENERYCDQLHVTLIEDNK